jgi:hypothetical protein
MDITDCAGWTSLHIASHCGHSEIVEFLLDCGADAAIANSRGETPFDLAHDMATQRRFLRYWGDYDSSIKSDTPLPRMTRPLTPYSDESSAMTETWMRIGAIHSTYNLYPLEDTIRNIFNNNHLKGLSMLITGEIISQRPLEIAMYLYSTPKLSPVKIGEVLGDNLEICKDAAKEFMSFLQIEPTNLLSSLSKLLKLIKLPKGLLSDQIIDVFSEKFHSHIPPSYTFHPSSDPNFNKTLPILSKDSIHHLIHSIITLNNHIHIENQDIQKHEYIENLKTMCSEGNFPEKYLSFIYDSIKKDNIQSVFHEQIAPVFDEVTYSGYLKYRFDNDWKEKYFILNTKTLWCYKSTTQATPYGCIPLWNLGISISVNYFSITGDVVFLRFSEDGSANVQHFESAVFRMDNCEMWTTGLQMLVKGN